MRLRSSLSLLGITVATSITTHAQLTFRGLGDLPGGTAESRATAVNSDGTIVVGYSNSTNGVEGFRWSSSSGMVGFGAPPDGLVQSKPTGVSADGSLVVGEGFGPYSLGGDNFRWTESAGFEVLGDPSNNDYIMNMKGVSADGTLFASRGGGTGSNGIRLHLDGSYDNIPNQTGGSYNNPNAISANGEVIVGSGNSTGGVQGYRWTELGGTESIGFLPNSVGFSNALGVSADGSFIVGFNFTDEGTEAYLWSETDGMVGLGELAGGTFSSSAVGVSADGSIVVGSSNSTMGAEAMFWSEETGMVSLYDFVSGQGVDLTDWSTFSGAAAINADGTAIVGSGLRNGLIEAFLITGFSPTLSAVPEPSAFALLSGFGIFAGVMLRRRPRS